MKSVIAISALVAAVAAAGWEDKPVKEVTTTTTATW
jgi:hypothetical protein